MRCETATGLAGSLAVASSKASLTIVARSASAKPAFSAVSKLASAAFIAGMGTSRCRA
ncbi:hypothetical protein D3C87_1994880 [compost metagenome]